MILPRTITSEITKLCNVHIYKQGGSLCSPLACTSVIVVSVNVNCRPLNVSAHCCLVFVQSIEEASASAMPDAHGDGLVLVSNAP